MFRFTTTVDNGIEVLVTYRVTSAHRATYGQPAEGGDVELLSVEGAPVTDAEWGAILAEAEARAYDDWADACADEADYRYEHRREASWGI